MAITRYVVTSQVNLAAGAFTLDATTGLRFGTGGWAQGVGLYGSGGGWVIPKGTLLELDSASPLVTAIGAGNLSAVTPGQETGGFYGTAN